ncbi:MAG: H4MPT-linked C1 transfer pathway protein [Candidatus Methanogaster sp.]|uniref:H4MPT-linked C1 transfer pathway protein n=1 Tax=Candidatus Methanogaster sp. TaxID=3386292 RepID=A0AC61L6K5_9EURY|nr:MAG: H4MPT-linked C1 transfer pathway protein [ANME-2 cluster archaeon]
MTTIGIDIGGANTKVASADGSIAEIHYLPMWKDAALPDLLSAIADQLTPEKVGVVMTGELADCFESKRQGIAFISDATLHAFPKSEIYYLNNKCEFTGGDDSRLAAANWAASAGLIARDTNSNCVFVDVGSTTTDIIPIAGGAARAGGTDFERLKRGELLYSGVLRTNLAALLDRVVLDGAGCRVSSELFAITADAYLVLGRIGEADYTCETPDHAGTTVADSIRRLARIVCADPDEIVGSGHGVRTIAEQVQERQVQELSGALDDMLTRHGLNRVVGTGLGEFLIRDAVGRLDGVECSFVSGMYGEDVSKVFPAYAVARLVEFG